MKDWFSVLGFRCCLPCEYLTVFSIERSKGHWSALKLALLGSFVSPKKLIILSTKRLLMR